MTFVQSRYQYYFSHCFVSFTHLFYGIAAYLVMVLIRGQEFSTESAMITIGVCAVLLAYDLFKFSRGAYTLEFNETGLRLTEGHLITEIKTEDFQGVKVDKIAPFTITIRNRVYGKTRIHYFSFSSQQRQQIFALLRELQPQSPQ